MNIVLITAAPKEEVVWKPTMLLQTAIDGDCTPTEVLQTSFDGSKSPARLLQTDLDEPVTPTSSMNKCSEKVKTLSHKVQPSTTSNISSISNRMATPKILNTTSPSKVNSTSIQTPLTSTPTKNLMSPALDFSTIPSPIEKSPPKNTRSAMDLFAIIHESKKKIQSIQKSSSVNWPKTIPGKVKLDTKMASKNDNSLKNASKSLDNKEVNLNGIMKHMPKPMSPLTDLNTQKYTRYNNSYNSLPRMKIQNYEESPKNLVQRKVYGRSGQSSNRGGPTSTQDFKKLLLQTGTGTGFVKQSAVDRLKSKNPVCQPIKHNILSTTIPEDCEGDEEVCRTPVMMSASLVNKQSKAFQARSSPTLETSL